MAIYRTISLSFWTDSKIIDDFTPEDRYFYLYLFTNPHTNLSGCYEISTRTMVNETGYSKDTIERLLERFKNTHKVLDYCQDTKEVMLINWHKYNWTTSEKFRKALGVEIEKIKNEKFKKYLRDQFNGTLYRYGIDTKCIDTNCSDTSVTDTVTDNNNNIYISMFEEIYKLYPRKGEKKRAYECYKARINNGFTEDELMIATKNYAEFCKKEHREQKYIKTAPTFYGVNTPFVDFLPHGILESDCMIYNMDNNLERLKAPYYGLPVEFFRGEVIMSTKVKPVKDITTGKKYSENDIVDEYYLRRGEANGDDHDLEFRPGG